MFNVGDKVKRIEGYGSGYVEGQIYTVTHVHPPDERGHQYISSSTPGTTLGKVQYFELVEAAPVLQQNSVLRYVTIYFATRYPDRIKTEFSASIEAHAEGVKFMQDNPADYTILAQKKLTLKY